MDYIGGIIAFFILLGLLVIFSILNINLKPSEQPKLVEIVTIEKMKNMDSPTSKVDFDLANNFCNHFPDNVNDLEQEVANFTKENCMTTKCSVWVNDEKCVAGNEMGPIYKTDNNGNKIPIDTYYYMNKCYGKCE